MNEAIELERLLFLDVESASGTQTYKELSPILQKHWKKRATRLLKVEPDALTEAQAAQIYADSAAIFAEYGRVVCISVGYLKFDSAGLPLVRVKSFYGDNEQLILQDFCKLLTERVGKYQFDWQKLCGHNIKEFDVPYIARRCLINGLLPLPYALNIAGMKPWEVPHIDTMELWKFGDYKAYTALELLGEVLGVPSPKTDIDGSEVSRVFWDAQDYARIARYCEQDVVATASVMLRMHGLPIPAPDAVTYSVSE